MNNKLNMNPIDQMFNTHSFGVDYIYGRNGSRFPTGELMELIFVTTITRTHQNVPHLNTKTTGNCLLTGKVNSIDNQ
jgi:hypothetical protein